jgi:hypothetical protein
MEQPIRTEVITWKDVFNYKAGANDIGGAKDWARLSGYPYFVWSDRIYHTASTKNTGLFAKYLDNGPLEVKFYRRFKVNEGDIYTLEELQSLVKNVFNVRNPPELHIFPIEVIGVS